MVPNAPDITPPTLLQVTDIRKSFNGESVIDGLSCEVKEGQAVCIIGESGCGKTTLLRCLSLLEYIDGGRISYRGDPVIEATSPRGDRSHTDTRCVQVRVNESAYRRRFGVVFQSFNLFPNKTVIQNVMEGPVYVLGRQKEKAKEHALEVLDLVGMRGRHAAYPHELSGGQQQRVAIARALAMQPEVLLFDEITSALDPPRVVSLLNVIRSLRAAETRTAMLVVTHHIEFAKDVADRVCFMHAGRIAVEGKPNEVLVDPDDRRLAAFLDSIRATQ